MIITDQLIQDSSKEDILRDLAAYKNDIYLYGAGLHANCICNWYCTPHDIKYAGVVVDDDYYKEDLSFRGKPVQPLSSLHQREKPFTLIVSMGGLKAASKRVQQQAFKYMESLILLDASSSFWEENDMTYQRAMENKDVLNIFGETLGDDLSRDILVAFLNSRISGCPDYLTKYCEPNQYFSKDLIRISDAEVVYDCGAYAGDTLEDYLSVSGGKFSKYIAIEPEINNASLLRNLVSAKNLHSVDVISMGLWDTEGVLKITQKGTCATISDTGDGSPIEVTTLDNIRRLKNIPCTLLKMDIEGAELKALNGGEWMIRNDKPKLAINVCHRPEDLLTIPQLIITLNPEYQLYLRHHSPEFAAEMVLYAI
ncbi:MAG: FkbM family methyltransferase [Chlorobium sp.]